MKAGSNLAAEDTLLGEILRSESIVSYFQPIISARQKCIFAVEALARGRVGSEVIPPSELFDMAEREGVSEQLDALCVRQAVSAFERIPDRSSDLLLFLNVAIPLTQTPAAIADALNALVRSAGLLPATVGIEVLEAEIADLPRLRSVIDHLRAHGFLLVLDDVGAGHSNLNRVPLIRPDVLKVDRSLIAGVDTDYHKQGALKSLVDLSRSIGALVVAEGIETEEEAFVALELGADLLQGFLLAKPGAHYATAKAPFAATFERIELLARSFRQHMAGKINERKLQNRRFNVVVNEILCDLVGASVEQFDTILREAITRYSGVECLYILDQAGIQVTETICNPSMQHRDRGSLFRPAPRGADHSLKEYYYILLDVELQKYTTDPYVSLASGNVSRTISTYFHDGNERRMYVLCVDVLCK
ncbi:MAG: EAL domain-containing protein [Vicinamibacterales bacterium]